MTLGLEMGPGFPPELGRCNLVEGDIRNQWFKRVSDNKRSGKRQVGNASRGRVLAHYVVGDDIGLEFEMKMCAGAF